MRHSLPLLAFNRTVVLVLCWICCTQPVRAQGDWVQKKSGHGITVYEASSGGKFKSVKVHAILNGTKKKLVQILQSVDQNTDWVYATIKSYLIEKTTDSNLVYYAETALPWPLKNRDQPIQLLISPETADSVLTITTVGVPDRIPVTEGLIRIRKFSGVWKVKTVNPRQIEIDYLLNVDPNGSVPAWLVNMFVAKGPFETFSRLAEKLSE